MRINGSNIVQGLFNYDTAPSEAIFTPNDIVVYSGRLYTCLGETSERPSPSSDNWEYYINKLSPVTTLEDALKPENEDKLVRSSVLIEYLGSIFPGANYNGGLKVWEDGPLDSITVNSRFQLTRDYLSYLKQQDPSSIPFSIGEGTLYIINTMGDIGVTMDHEPTYFFQELIEIHFGGSVDIWMRSGPSLATAPWTLHTLATGAEDYIDYINSKMSALTFKEGLFEGFLQDFSDGQYKIWKAVPTYLLPTGQLLSIVKPNFPFQTGYTTNKYYKVYLNIVDGANKYKDFIEISPEDHDFLLLNESFNYKRVPGVLLTKVQEDKSDLTLPAGVTISGISESYDFAV